MVVDCESGPVRLGLAGGLAQALGAEYLNLDSLSAGDLAFGARPAGRVVRRELADSVRGWRADRVDRKVA